MRVFLIKAKATSKRIVVMAMLMVTAFSQSAFASTTNRFYDAIEARMSIVDILLIGLVFVAILGTAFDLIINRKNPEEKSKAMESIPTIVIAALIIVFALLIVKIAVGAGASGNATYSLNTLRMYIG